MDLKMTAEIDLMESAAYIVKDGVLKKLPNPESGHGKQIISWQGNKPCYAKLETDIKF
ncbi:DUF3954 domain-containing protein [Domibacillus sp. A3M-37]|uniref:DUF3954 domain-containing protein n=1 Tax=Domibacillus sp. A3M-37 TaxID=2962037 RepID=UPI0020B63C55|nr:DUF3954 domain-containing protein [Domibacillus sp. A3M-37]MCP3763868.1 DUF3954 domain-containing protein [Domibacillus sp. A3M-37]